jgi:hypothetical protein
LSYAFINDLCESHLIPSQTSLKRWDDKKLAELAYLYFLGLRILLGDKASKHWARDYCKKAGEPNSFDIWRSTGNDLYVMLFALNDSKEASINPSMIRHWLRHVATHDDPEATRRLFVRLDAMFRITNSQMRSMRRVVTDWEDVDNRERKVILDKLVQMIDARAPSNSELLPHLKMMDREVDESATAGATGAGNVATAVGGLGVGFTKDTSASIYWPQKPIVIRR